MSLCLGTFGNLGLGTLIFSLTMSLPTQIPQTQKAWRVVAQGPPSKALRLDKELPVPTQLDKGNVLVKVQAAALNPV